jgi:hypothetical protein
LLDIELIHTFLSKSSYWARDRSYEVVKKSIELSLGFGVYQDVQQEQRQQVGFARVVTDYSTFDIFLLYHYDWVHILTSISIWTEWDSNPRPRQCQCRILPG